MHRRIVLGLTIFLWCMLGASASASQAADEQPEQLIESLSAYAHAQQIVRQEQAVRDHEIGLGAMQKVRGSWRLKNSERLSGDLLTSTWQIVDGFSAFEVLEGLESRLMAMSGSERLFACDGRACGQGVQWANRVFQQRLLYGREEFQRYRVYQLNGDAAYRVLLYSSSRSADRQYLLLEILRITP